jgi:hypothetical protein
VVGPGKPFSLRRLFIISLVAIVATGFVGPAGGAAADRASATTTPAPRTAEEMGLNYAGLRAGTPVARCKGELTLATADTTCTHGPDRAPVGVDVRHRWIPKSAGTAAATTTASPSVAAATAGIQCYGDGTTGDRVQAIYAHAADVTDRYAQVASSIRQWAAQVDTVFNASAGETSGVRHVRYVTDSSCNLSVLDIQLTAAGDDNIGNTITDLRNAGYSRSDRKYLVWVDANVYCGIAQVYGDDSASQSNLSNGSSSVSGEVARVDNGCWGVSGQSIEAHELMHTLGGVQTSAPHATSYNHCWDRYDRMCYDDGSGSAMQIVCNDSSHENRFDCNHDDYFYAGNPPASNYLSNHWNSANSAFLASTQGTPPTTTPPTTTPPTTTPPTTTPPTTTPPPASGTAAAKPGVFRSGAWYLRQSLTTGGAQTSFGYGNPGDVPLMCDWDGDGTKTPAIYRNGVFYLSNTAGAGAAAVFAFGNPGDVPVCGDWNGDGVDTVGIFRAGIWFVRNSNSAGPADAVFAFGAGGDTPLVGDWNGNGTDGIGIWRAGMWFLRPTPSGGPVVTSFAYGNSTDDPITGDWNGDGVDSPGITRAGVWYLRNSVTAGGADSTFAYGDADDVPVVWR